MLKPFNNYLVVEPVKEHVKEYGVIIPDDVDLETSVHKTVTLVVPNTKSQFLPGARLLIPTHMLEEVTFSGEKYYLVPENCVMGYESD